MFKRNYSVVFLALLAIVIFNFSSCKTDPTTPPQKEVTSEPTTVTSRLRAEPDRLNPMLTFRGWSLHVARFLFPTLIEFSPATLKLEAQLVKSLPVIKPIEEGKYKGGMSYSFEILEEAVWDNGQPITGNDYAFTLKVMMNPHVASDAYKGFFNMIRKVDVDPNNPKKFVVYTDQQYIKAEHAAGYFIFPEYIFDPTGLLKDIPLVDILDPEKIEDLAKNNENLKQFGEQFNDPSYSRDADKLVGAGGYRLEEWIAGERIVLAKKENWWGDKLKNPHPLLVSKADRIVFIPIPDETAALSMIKSQTLDVMGAITEVQFEDLKKNEFVKEHYNFYTPQVLGITFVSLNTKNEKLQDKRVRRALAHLMDVDKVVNSIKKGYAVSINGPFHPSRDYYHKELPQIKLNIEQSKTLLTEAGWTDSNGNGTVDKMIGGQRVEMELEFLMTPTSKTSEAVALILQNEAEKVGVKINPIAQEANKFRGNLNTRNYEMYLGGSQQDLGLDDPRQTWHTESDTPNGSNRSGFGSAKTDELINELRKTMDVEKRNAMYLELQEAIYEEQPYIFLYTTLDRILINKRFKDVETTIQSPRFFENQWSQ